MSVTTFYLRYRGLKVGKDCMIYSNIATSEPYLVSIGDNVTISFNVQFITHDNSICKVSKEVTDLFGKIKIGNNCFIGAASIILPGVAIGDNVIVAVGSVVTKSFGNNVVIAGNPAKIIYSIENYVEKNIIYACSIKGKSSKEKRLLINSIRLLEK